MIKLEQTLFCTAQGLLEFSKAINELFQKLISIHNFYIKDFLKDDKLEFWGEPKTETHHNLCYGRHFLFNNQHDVWIGLDITTDKVTVTISVDTKSNNKKTVINLEELNNAKYSDVPKVYEASIKDEYFERFCESLSSQILANFAAEVLKAINVTV